MLASITCHPGAHGRLHRYTVKAIRNGRRIALDILARTGRDAIAAFRAATEISEQDQQQKASS